MKMKNSKWYTLLFLAVLSVQVSAQAPKYSNEFLSIGVGARALAMSNTQVSFVNDGTAGYWNPIWTAGNDFRSPIIINACRVFCWNCEVRLWFVCN